MRQESSTDKRRGRRRGARIIGVAAIAAATLLVSACAGPAEADKPATGDDATAPSAAGFSDELTAQLQEAVESVMNDYDVPGASVGVWVPGRGEWTRAFGVADLATGAPVTLEMSWPIRSITKSYTVTLLLQLADEGKLKLTDTLDMYVPGVTNGDRITLLELANMSSGVADYVNEDFLQRFEADPTHVFTLAELNQGVLGQPAQFEPGTEYVYTNANTNLIAAVIEKVTGQPFADVLNTKILSVAGLPNTHYYLDVAQWTEPHPTGYMPGDDGSLEPQEQNPSILGPAGALVSTLDDGHQWALTLGSGLFLRGQTQAQRLEGHEISSPPYDLYGAGVGITDDWIGHNGEGIGFTAATFYHQATGSVIVVYMNESNIPDGAHPADLAFRNIAEVLKNSGM